MIAIAYGHNLERNLGIKPAAPGETHSRIPVVGSVVVGLSNPLPPSYATRFKPYAGGMFQSMTCLADVAAQVEAVMSPLLRMAVTLDSSLGE